MCGSESSSDHGKYVHLVTELIDSMDVIMSEPSRVGHGQSYEINGCEGSRAGRGSSSNDKTGIDPNELGLLDHISLPPSIGFELGSKFAEIDLGGGVGDDILFELGDDFGIGFGKTLPHYTGLFGMESVHDFSGITAIVPVDPVAACWIGLAPSCYCKVIIMFNNVYLHIQ